LFCGAEFCKIGAAMPSTLSQDLPRDVASRALALGISEAALELYDASEVIDLHIDSFIWSRVLGYDLRARHGTGLLGGRFYSQVDLPRALSAGLSGAMWSITTNPFRSAAGRRRALQKNVLRWRALFESQREHVAIASSAAEYRAARAQGKHAAFLALQGGNALDPRDPDPYDSALLRVTLVHLTSSRLGTSSSPLRAGSDRGLGPDGAELIERLNAQRIFVDLAHISRRGFFEAVAVHDRTQPLLVTHTGLAGVYPSWRNIDDEQLKRIADSGGVVGVIFCGEFLSGKLWSGGAIEAIVAHLAHVIRVAGEDAAALGSDWDGAIIPPRALRSCDMLPKLVQALLDAGFSQRSIRKLLGENFLRALQQLRP
jgi:membrane dipeptidase